MKLKVYFLLVFLAAFGAKAQNYINPMDIPTVLSASFAELRSNHFHGGLDISTPHTGVPVRSVADGFVSRIKVSPYGCGYGLYINHYDGHTTVYGHLSEYAPKIDSVIRKEQYRLQSFDVDFFPDQSLLPVKQGEIVAYSGNSGGSLGPHLHLEVRDTKTDDPLNPLEYLEKEVADHRAPTVYGIKAYALDDTSAVEEKYYELKWIENKTIDAYGHVGFGINAVDFFDVGGRPCGVVEVSLYDNEMLVFRSVLDRMPFDKTRYINSFVDFAEVQSDNRFIQKSFIDPNNRLDIYKECKPIIVKPGELHRMRYELKDFVGNVKKVSFNVRGVTGDSFEPRICRGRRLSWAKDYNIETFGMTINILANNFYKDEYLVIVKSDSNAFNRPLYTVGSRAIPVHDHITLTLPLPEDYKKLLDGALSADEILLRISSVFGKEMIPGKTLIFFDEVQECKEIVTQIKYLVQDGTYKYILSGSLLGVIFEELLSVPVGYMGILQMFPLDLEEFAWANGVDDRVIDALKQSFDDKTQVDSFIHDRMLDLVRLYLIVGGMPAAVEAFLNSHNLYSVLEVQKDIIKLFPAAKAIMNGGIPWQTTII